jgi:hypothetical protein
MPTAKAAFTISYFAPRFVNFHLDKESHNIILMLSVFVHPTRVSPRNDVLLKKIIASTFSIGFHHKNYSMHPAHLQHCLTFLDSPPTAS